MELPSPGTQHGPRKGSGPPPDLCSPRMQLPSPITAQHLLGNISYLSVLLVEGALKCGSMGGGPTQLCYMAAPKKG